MRENAIPAGLRAFLPEVHALQAASFVPYVIGTVFVGTAGPLTVGWCYFLVRAAGWLLCQ